MKNWIKASAYVLGGFGLLAMFLWACFSVKWFFALTMIVIIAFVLVLLVFALKKCFDEEDKDK